MGRVAFRGLLAHRLRFALTTLAVVLGVSFVAGTFMLTDSIDDAFTGLFGDINADTDLYVRPASPVGTDITEQWTSAREPFAAEVADEVAQVEGVAVVDGWVEAPTQLVGEDGEPIGGQGPPVLGFSWSDAGGPLYVRDGRAPQAAGEIVIDAVSAERGGFRLGDRVRAVTPSGSEGFALVGIVGFGESDNLLGATIAAFELDEARRLFGKEGRFDQLAVVVADDAEVAVVADRIASVVGERGEVLTAQQSADEGLEDIRGFLSIINSALLGFAFVAIFVGALIIANTFSMTVAQRTREFALLRAIGASTSQVSRAVRIEALVVGLVASGLGLLVGIWFATGLKAVLDAFGMGIPTGGTIIQGRTVMWAFAVGVGVTLLASAVPARAAARVSPVEGLRDGGGAGHGSLRRRLAVGSVSTTAGALAVAVGLVVKPDSAAVYVGAGAAVSLLGLTVLSPFVAGPISGALGALPARIGVPGRLARGNARRDSRRTGTTASALMVGLAVVSFATVFAASVNATVADQLDQQFRGDFAVSTSQPGYYDLPPALADELATRPELSVVSRGRRGAWAVDGEPASVTGIDPATVGHVIELGAASGSLDALAPGRVLVADDVAEERGLAVGDRIAVAFARSGQQTAVVVGTFANTDMVGSPYLISLDSFEENFGSQLDAFVMANAAEGVPLAEARTAVEETVERYPNAEVRDRTELRAEAESQINQVLGLMTVLLALAVVVALIGITNTLALAVLERTREIGLLRAVGMTRRQVRSMVRWESAIVAVLGAVLGTAVGVVFGWAVVRSLADEGFQRLVVPGGQLLAYVLVAAVAGVVAALFPARRAARLDMLSAVTVE